MADIEQLGKTQRKMLRQLMKHPDGVSVDEMVSSIGISTNAVRQHIAALERDGYLQKGTERPTGRRPQQLFVLTSDGRELFPRHYSVLAEGLIESVKEEFGADALIDLMRNMGDSAGSENSLKAKRGTSEKISNELAAAMTKLGYEAVSGTNIDSNQGEVVAYNCVFHHLAARYPEVCEFDLAFIESSTGRKVTHAECMVRGGSVCRFLLNKKDKNAR